jgi:hypothetical protein
MSGKIILTCGHEELNVPLASSDIDTLGGLSEFGHTISFLDYDDIGNDSITTFSVCSACLPWYQEKTMIFSSVEEGFQYIEKEKQLTKDLIGNTNE